MFALRALFVSQLLTAMVLSAYILRVYLKRALAGSAESKWLGQHITAVAAAHLLSLSWSTARFLIYGHEWWWPWIAALLVILTLSNYGIWQMYKYRRWRERRHLSGNR